MMSGSERQIPRVLVIGIGNPERGDDAVGAYVAGFTAECCLADTRVITHDGEGTGLLQTWVESGAELVVLVDAALSGREPGTVSRVVVTNGDFAREEIAGSTHGFGVFHAVELGRLLGQLPDHLIAYLIEAGQFDPGHDLSPQVKTAAERVSAMICDEIESFFAVHPSLLAPVVR